MSQNRKLSFGIRQFEQFQTARKMAPATIRNRVSHLLQLQSVIGDIPLNDLQPWHFDQLFQTKNWAASSMNQRLSTYGLFLKWCRGRGFMDGNLDPLVGWRRVKVPEVERIRIPVQQWPSLFEATISPMERMVLASGLYLFLRVSEQQCIQLKHLHLDQPKPMVDIWRPKTKQWDSMPITSELEPFIREQLTWMSSRGHTLTKDSYLIPYRLKMFDRDEKGARWLPATQWIDPSRPFTHGHRIVQNVLDRVGFRSIKGEGGHTLRRSGARAYFDALSEKGYDGALRRVQSMLGHTSSIHTEIYLGLDVDRASRNEDLAGKPMFPGMNLNGVTRIRRAS